MLSDVANYFSMSLTSSMITFNKCSSTFFLSYETYKMILKLEDQDS